jgi:hypothetical protein
MKKQSSKKLISAILRGLKAAAVEARAKLKRRSPNGTATAKRHVVNRHAA